MRNGGQFQHQQTPAFKLLFLSTRLRASRGDTNCNCYLSLEALDQMTDCHTARNGMRVDNHIRSDPFTREWHVLHKQIKSINYNSHHQNYHDVTELTH